MLTSQYYYLLVLEVVVVEWHNSGIVHPLIPSNFNEKEQSKARTCQGEREEVERENFGSDISYLSFQP